ncbi:RagB/SusD family nutrient uptake outer membrane protein [Pedobacter sp. Leaf132]|uniref:RagB/SusD family nutrient uptake outer membrane protein n=1 Tax=Pedobacter sp. Leaf132 TaxID=2876557 RepID=UPI001E478F58|nr:RagB/SusD family nutrient uptake outer membrane protein [Pedobacter sp. Leaf132]
MKKIFIFFMAVTMLSACKKALDVDNLLAYDPEQIWNDPLLADAYLTNIYPTAFGNHNVTADGNSDQLSGIYFPQDAVTITNGGLGNWNYAPIRLVNQALLDIPKGTLPDATKNRILGEAYFLRAYFYFGMVRTYGGVPYIKIPQDRFTDELNVPRNSTKECFDFMYEDLDKAISLLPKRNLPASSSWGKIDGNFALAFKARMSLFKASPQFNPNNPWDNTYWADAYTVNKKAYDDLKAQGYQLVADYANTSLAERNTEVVFSVINQFPDKTANWDNGIRPLSLSRGNVAAAPTLEFVKAFPMLDGKLYNDPTSAYFVSEADFLKSYWKNRDPRFNKSIVWNAKAYPVSGTITGYRQYTALGIANALDNNGINPNSPERSTNNNVHTGFFILKNSDLTLTQANVLQYGIDYVLMRYAEVMLNYAEAANETNRPTEALDILKQIRTRAGIEAGTNGNYGITATTRVQIRQAIMEERNIELCFEGFRFNDLRRWRMFSLLDNKGKTGLEAVAIEANGTEMSLSKARPLGQTNQLLEENFKYVPLSVPQTGNKLNILPEKYYFAPIQQSIIANANKLQQNKDWGGSFDPTLQ